MTHQAYMSLALQLAKRGRLSTSPNPMVGCVIVKDNQIVGQGFHERAGEPHAEVYALREAGLAAQGATAYITLEPCCHQGRTPPCTDALIRARLKKVYVACLDPNPLVAGKGMQALLAAGIEVRVGIGEAEATDLNKLFFYYIQHQRPFVIVKWAMSLDGKTITNPDDSRAISSLQSQRAVHETREQVDAILIGSKTAIHDNPSLTVRRESLYNCESNSKETLEKSQTKQPLRIILSSQGQLPLDLKMFDQNGPGKTVVVTTDAINESWYTAMLRKKVEVIITQKNPYGQVHLRALLNELGKRQITSLLVEGGMTIHASFFQENLVNKVHVYLAPYIIGALTKKRMLKNINLAQIDSDYFFTADDDTCLMG